MTDADDNVLIRCPNGHALQTPRAHLGMALACPVCNATFTPTDLPAEPGAAPPTAPTQLGYADRSLGQPVVRPAFTVWLVRLWIGTCVLQVGGAFLLLTGTSGPSASSLDNGLTCCQITVTFAAIVLQLMWIYRIHADARRARGYQEVSPGLALGLSFLPVFNYPWTAWILFRLARASASGERQDDPAALEAVKWARACIPLGIMIAVSSCVVGVVLTSLIFEQFSTAMAAGAQGAAMPPGPIDLVIPPATQALVILAGAISLAGTIVYVRTIRLVERSLYAFLGA